MRVEVSHLAKAYGKTQAIRDISFEVNEGELVVLLGPSGCGKTTALRCIAGFEKPEKGRIKIGERIVFDANSRIYVPSNKRNLGMVFQSYAIWPHMTVYENVAYGPTVRGLNKKEIDVEISRVMELVGLSGFESKSSTELSGGQMQRVALARSLVFQPSLLLMDEPLSNLDLKLRNRLRFNIKEIQKKTGVTSIYVTHDQTEAVVLADRLIIMKDGTIVQEGTPLEIYNSPRNLFIADFIAIPNMIEGSVQDVEGQRVKKISFAGGFLSCNYECWEKPVPGRSIWAAIRSEDIMIAPNISPRKFETNLFEGNIREKWFFGTHFGYQIRIGTLSIEAMSYGKDSFAVGTNVDVYFPPESLIILENRNARG